jgi:putative aldouronate transport system substrate-binding protein
MKKRIFILLTAGLLIAGLVTGCGGAQTTQAATTQAAATTAAATTAAEATTIAATTTAAATTAAPAAEATTVIWYAPGDKAEEHDMVINELNKKLADRVNAKLDFRIITFGEFGDKMRLATTSGENFDLMYTSSWLNSFVDNVARSALLPLDDLISEYGKDLYNSIPEWVFDAGRAGSALYGIPNYQMIGSYYGIYLQKEYVEKYGLDPKSITKFEDLEPFFKQILENEPNLYPLQKYQSPKYWPIYEYLPGELSIRKDDATLKILPKWEAFEEEWRYSNYLYKEKIIRQDILTMGDDSADRAANRYVGVLNIAKPGGDAEMTANHKKEYILIPTSDCYINYDSGVSTMTAISSTSKHPEETMKLYNVIYTDKEIFNMLLFGLEGTHYKKTGESRIEPVENSKYFYGGNAWAYGNQLLAYYLPGQEDGTWEETERLLNTAVVSPLRGFYFDPSPVQAELAQCDAVLKEFDNQQYVATDIDAFISDITNKLKAAGMETVVAEFQKQVDAWAVSVGKK